MALSEPISDALVYHGTVGVGEDGILAELEGPAHQEYVFCVALGQEVLLVLVGELLVLPEHVSVGVEVPQVEVGPDVVLLPRLEEELGEHEEVLGDQQTVVVAEGEVHHGLGYAVVGGGGEPVDELVGVGLHETSVAVHLGEFPFGPRASLGGGLLVPFDGLLGFVLALESVVVDVGKCQHGIYVTVLSRFLHLLVHWFHLSSWL